MPDFIEIDSLNLGKVLATGCGADGLMTAIDAIDSYSFRRPPIFSSAWA